MQYWNLAYEYVALFFLFLVIIWYFNEKRIPRHSHSIFLIFLATVFCAIGFKVIAVQIMDSALDNGNLFLLFMSLQFFVTNMVAYVFSIYLLEMSHYRSKYKTVLKAVIGTFVCISAVIALLNPKMQWAFTIQDGIPKVEYGGHVMYILAAIILCISFFITFKNKNSLYSVPIIPLVFIVIFSVVGFFAQTYWYVPALNIVFVAIGMTVFHYEENSGTVTDSVTGLFSRRFMGEYLRNRFHEGKSFGVILVAMDDFKFINKNYGVDTGDHLLYQVGHFLKHLKGFQYVFRFGSDQFCVVLRKDIENMDKMAENIMERFRHPWFDESQAAVMMSASICYMECPEDAAAYEELIELIDYSMSVAKNTRKGRITSVREIDMDKLKHDKAIEKAMRLALDRDELLVYYQPIFSVEKGVYNSAEALVRLHDDELGWISPEDFIPIAERNGLIIEMGELILEKVCRFIRDFNIKDTTVEYIEVNISPVQLIQANFSERVKEILEEYDVSPSQINIEITETVTMGTTDIISQNINHLLNYGITFSLDDYGSGNANIDYINRMPFRIIKIDKYIIWDSFKNSKAGITLEYTIGMLNALNLHIVAEGVETEEMRQQLAKFGCHYMQGWLYSKAVPDVEFIQLLQAQGK